MKKENGFTLVEVVVVVAIGLLLMAWGVPSYSTWKKKHDIENEMVQLYGDLQYARLNAYTGRAVSGVWWGGGGLSIATYEIRTDTNSNGNINDSGTDTRLGNPVVLKYPISVTNNQASVSYDGRGFLNTGSVTFYISGSYGAGMDCVALSNTRISLGKMNAGTCSPK